jgi:hypothetical protein
LQILPLGVAAQKKSRGVRPVATADSDRAIVGFATLLLCCAASRSKEISAAVRSCSRSTEQKRAGLLSLQKNGSFTSDEEAPVLSGQEIFFTMNAIASARQGTKVLIADVQSDLFDPKNDRFQKKIFCCESAQMAGARSQAADR